MTTDEPVVPDAPRRHDAEDEDFFIAGVKRRNANQSSAASTHDKASVNSGRYLMRSAMEAVDEMSLIGRNVDPWIGVFSSDKGAFLDLYDEAGDFDALAVYAITTTSRDTLISRDSRTAATTRWPGDTGVYVGQTLDADGRGGGHLQEAKRHPDRKSSQAANAAKGKKTLALVRVQQSKFKSFADKIEEAFPALRPLLERILGYPPTPRQIVQVFLLAVEAYYAAIFRAYRKHLMYNEILDEHLGEIDSSIIGLNGNGCLSSGLVDDSRVVAAGASRATALATSFQPRAGASAPPPVPAPRPFCWPFVDVSTAAGRCLYLSPGLSARHRARRLLTIDLRLLASCSSSSDSRILESCRGRSSACHCPSSCVAKEDEAGRHLLEPSLRAPGPSTSASISGAVEKAIRRSASAVVADRRALSL